ncbi:MAG: hypothetical protein ABJK64_11290 [Paraglaciecola sp.]|uniref:hypothetical protein n=1 Tax=Paraglaciecola sp. TaxID=1920173 RepID=UPI0032995336
MNQTHYIVISVLVLCCIGYVARQLFKRINLKARHSAAAPHQDSSIISDDLMCIMKADGSTITTRGEITVIGSRTE